MDWLRQNLRRLGWPVDSLSNEEIGREIYRRWSTSYGMQPEPEQRISLAAANGIFVDMADEGNLDGLCWSEEDDPTIPDDLIPDESGLYDRKASPDTDTVPDGTRSERRRSPRAPASDFIDFVIPASSDGASGWLIDSSTDGVAFITETKDVPKVGSWIIPTIRRRDGQSAELGGATVVRTELLSDILSLVCAQLEESWSPQP